MAEPKLLKNYLSVALGIIIRDLRNQLSLSYDEIAAMVGVKPSYFQAFEQGNAIFSVSKSYPLYEAVKKIWPNSLPGIIECNALISQIESKATSEVEKYTASCIDKSEKPTIEARNNIYTQAITNAISHAAGINERYSKLARQCAMLSFKRLKTNEDLAKAIYDLSIIHTVSEFVRDVAEYTAPTSTQIGHSAFEFFNNVQTIHIQLFESLRNEVKLLPATISREDLYAWELRNANDITEVTIFSTMPFFKHPLFASNFTSYPYIFQPQFTKLKLVNSGIVPQEFDESEFIKLIKSVKSGDNGSTKDLDQTFWQSLQSKTEFSDDDGIPSMSRFYESVQKEMFHTMTLMTMGIIVIYKLTRGTFMAFLSDDSMTIWILTVKELKDAVSLIGQEKKKPLVYVRKKDHDIQPEESKSVLLVPKVITKSKFDTN